MLYVGRGLCNLYIPPPPPITLSVCVQEVLSLHTVLTGGSGSFHLSCRCVALVWQTVFTLPFSVAVWGDEAREGGTLQSQLHSSDLQTVSLRPQWSPGNISKAKKKQHTLSKEALKRCTGAVGQTGGGTLQNTEMVNVSLSDRSKIQLQHNK